MKLRLSTILAHALLLAALVAVSACSTRPGMVRDLEVLPQEAGAFHNLPPQEALIQPADQARLFADFLKKQFAPWRTGLSNPSPEMMFWAIDTYKNKKIYGQNKLRYPQEWMARMEALSDVAHYPSMSRPAITVKKAFLRTLPTLEPMFYDFSKAGEGFPFDYGQNSLVLPATPIRALHMSADRAWVLVRSRHAFGWLPANEVAWVDEDFMRRFNAPGFITFTKDKTVVLDSGGSYRFTAEIGTILPLSRQPGKDHFSTLIPVRTANGNAALRHAIISKDVAAPAPLPATPRQFAALADQMLGRPYGWGGLYGDRDCSATVMDLMASFGIYLPRNSSQQYKAGHTVELGHLGRRAKLQAIRENAIPFMTLIRAPGHIMLFIGTWEGHPVVLHSTWGVKTRFFGSEGRHIIGRTVITTLQPGKELWDIARHKGNVLDQVYGMSFIKTRK